MAGYILGILHDFTPSDTENTHTQNPTCFIKEKIDIQTLLLCIRC